MAVQEISKERFDSYNPLRRRPADNALTCEVAWFENSESGTIGVVVESKQYDDFAVVSFVKADEVGFQAYDIRVAVESLLNAKQIINNLC
jgi:hypothetical protein